MKKFITIFSVLAVLSVTALFVVPEFIDWNSFRKELCTTVEETTGRKCDIEGAIKFNILPAPSLNITKIVLSNQSDPPGLKVFQADSLKIEIGLRPLLTGDVRIKSITLVRPVLLLEQTRNGQAKWSLEKLLRGNQKTESQYQEASSLSSKLDISLDSADIIDGVLILRDERSKMSHKFEAVEANIVASSLRGPFSAGGSFTFAGFKTGFQTNMGKIDPFGSTNFSTHLTLLDIDGIAFFDGLLKFDHDLSIEGDASIKIRDFTSFSDSLNMKEGTINNWFEPNIKSLDVNSKIIANSTEIRASNVTIQSDNIRLTGSLNFKVREKPEIDATLYLNRLDLNQFKFTNPAVSNTGIQKSYYDQLRPFWDRADFALPSDISVNLSLYADAIDLNDHKLRKLQIETRLANGIAKVALFKAQLPGATDVKLSGQLYSDSGLPRFVGQAKVFSDNARVPLTWMGISLEGVSKKRFRKGNFTADLDLSPKQIQVNNWSMTLDNTNAICSLSFLVRKRPAFGFSILIDRMNLDSYLKIPTPSAKTSLQVTSAKSDVLNFIAREISFISKFDANFMFSADEIQFENQIYKDVNFKGMVKDSVLLIRELSIAEWLGASLKIRGSIDNKLKDPVAKIETIMEGASLARFSDLSYINRVKGLNDFGPFVWKSEFSGSLEMLNVNSKLILEEGGFDLKGKIRSFDQPLNIDFGFKVHHLKSKRLIGLAFQNDGQQELEFGPASIVGRIWTDNDGKISIQSRLKADAARIGLDAMIEPSNKGQSFNAKISFQHDDINRLMKAIEPELEVSFQNSVPVTFAVVLEGKEAKITLKKIRLGIGADLISGSGEIYFEQKRPKILLTLLSDKLEISNWLQFSELTPDFAILSFPMVNNDREWSHKKISLKPLVKFDADIEISAKRIVVSPYIIENAVLFAGVHQGKAKLDRFSGNFFGGNLFCSGSVTAKPIPEIEISLKIEQAQLKEIFGLRTNNEQLHGIVDYDMVMSSRGSSQFELVSALRGSGLFQIIDGKIVGIDLYTASKQLEQVRGAVEFLKLMQTSFSGGETPFEALTGSYIITDGILRSDDISLESVVAVGEGMLAYDVSRQFLDLKSKLWLKRHINSPAIGLSYIGPVWSPRIAMETERMRAHIIQKNDQREILRDLHKSSPEVTTDDKIKSNEAFKGILEGLRK